MSIDKTLNILKASARANKYRVSFTWPSALQGETPLEDVDVLAKASQAPTRELGQIEVWNKGRKAIIPGDTVFDNAWSVDFYLTEDHQLRKDLILWMDKCDNFQANTHTKDPREIYASLMIEQLDGEGNVTATYTLHNAFPQTIGEVSYGADSADTIAEFNTVFAYSDWVIGKGETNES